MKTFLLTFCDYMIDRLCEHGVRGDNGVLKISKEFFETYVPELNFLGFGTSLVKGTEFALLEPPGGRDGFLNSRSSLNQIFRFFRSLVEVLVDFDEKLTQTPFDLSFLTGLKELFTWHPDNFIKHAKFITAYPLAKWLRNPLPETPSTFEGSPLLFSGPLRRYLRNRLNSKSKSNASLFFGYLQGVKRGAAPVSESFILSTERKHRENLLRQPERNWAQLVDFAEYLDRFFRNLPETKFKFYEASQAASIESKRSSGGSKGHIIRDYFGPTEGSIGLYSDQEDLFQMEEVRPGITETGRAFVAPINEGDILRQIRILANENLTVRVCAVLEPLKVRLITKGESWPYYFSRFYQKFLWRYLQRFPQFSLTGRVLQENDLYEMLEREKTLDLNFQNDPDSFFVSGDYSNATDNLNLYFTRETFEASLRKAGLSSEQMNILRSVIYEQLLTYSSEKDPLTGEFQQFRQRNGQLMGSTLSFPILCIVNLVCYWKALERYLSDRAGVQIRVKIKDLPVLVNGDDIGFRANSRFYHYWIEEISHAGFELSLGKNYCSRNYLTINSRMFYFSMKGKIPDFEEVGYLNVGLLQNTVVDRRRGAVRPIYDNYNELISRCNNKIFAHRRFFHYNFDVIQRVTGDGEFNLFISPYLGGLGFQPCPEIMDHIHITSFQRRFGSYLLNRLRSGLRTSEALSEFYSSLLKIYNPDLSDSSYKPIRKHHFGNYKLVDLFGPLDEFRRDVSELEFAGPIMATNPLPSKTLDLKFPSNRLLRDFRTSVYVNKLSLRQLYRPSRILTQNLRLVEVIDPLSERTSELLDKKSPFTSMAVYSSDIN